MNQKKAKALRRVAKHAAAGFPAVHNMRASYQDIVRQTTQEFEVPDENIVQKGMRFLGRLLGKKSKPKTKLVEKVIHESRQTVLVAGWRFIQQRLKAAIRRREARITASGAIVPTGTGTRRGIRASILGGAL